MEKVSTLDVKMQIELSSLTAKMDAMRAEMGAFDDLEGLRMRAQVQSRGAEGREGGGWMEGRREERREGEVWRGRGTSVGRWGESVPAQRCRVPA